MDKNEDIKEQRRVSSPLALSMSQPTNPGVSTPKRRFSSPVRKSISGGDRFIPSRLSSKLEDAFDIMDQEEKIRNSPNADSSRPSQGTLNNLIRSELLGQQRSCPSEHDYDNLEIVKSPTSAFNNVLKYNSENNRQTYIDECLSPTSSLLLSPSSRWSSPPSKNSSKRKISRVPYKILDAPGLQDDFYLNLVDWSSTNILSVGLGSCVYLWSANTSKVSMLCDVEETVTSVTWAAPGTHLAVGTNSGKVLIWDVAKAKQTQELGRHSARVGTLAWGSELLASGSRDKQIFLQDLRVRSTMSPDTSVNTTTSSSNSGQDQDVISTSNVSTSATSPSIVRTLSAHKQEVCGLKWSPDEKQLASGGNDNKLNIWSMHGQSTEPVHQFADHMAAVKAISWSPHQHGLMASGGGTADRHIRFWNTLTGTALQRIDTGSQVCNLTWSRDVNEIVSTHGYSLNQVIVWKYPSMTKVATLTGHTFRVLYLALSPDGESVVTGAGDETLRFWNVFPENSNRSHSWTGGSCLFPVLGDIR